MLDIDGVVVNPYPDGRSQWYDRLREDLSVDPGQLHDRFFARFWDEIVRGKLDLKHVLAPVLDILNPDLSVEALTAYWFEHHAEIDYTVVELARDWSERVGSRVCLASNQERYRAAYLWNQLNLSQCFDALVYSAEIGVTKSEVEFFRIAQHRLDINSHPIIFFDDDDANVRVARMASWDAHLYEGVASLSRVLLRDL